MNQPDYIVVGAGSAGCILARRLAQEFGAVVTIVEAPCKAAPQIDHLRPARWLRLLKSSEDWDFTTPLIHLSPIARFIGLEAVVLVGVAGSIQ